MIHTANLLRIQNCIQIYFHFLFHDKRLFWSNLYSVITVTTSPEGGKVATILPPYCTPSWTNCWTFRKVWPSYPTKSKADKSTNFPPLELIIRKGSVHSCKSNSVFYRNDHFCRCNLSLVEFKRAHVRKVKRGINLHKRKEIVITER